MIQKIIHSYKNPFFWGVFSISSIAFISTLSFLSKSEFAFGLDGYYYAAQVKSYVEKGRFFMPDFSLALYFLVLLSKLGNDIVLTNKIGVSIIFSTISIPAYFLGRRISDRFGGIFLSAFVLSNSLIFYCAIEFVKNLFGILFLLFFLGEYVIVLRDEFDKRRIAALFLFAVLSLLSHKLTGVICLLFLFLIALFHFKKIPTLWRAVFISGLLLAVVLSYLFALLNVFDFNRFAGLDFASPQITSVSYWKEIQPASNIYIFEILLFAISPVLVILLWPASDRYQKKLILSFLLLYFISNFPFLKFEGKDAAFRLYMLVFIPSGLLILLAIKNFPRKVLVAVSILVLAFLLPSRDFHKNRTKINYAEFRDLLPKITVPPNALLIAHPGFDFFYCFTARKDAFRFLPEPKHEGRPIYRLVFGIDRGYISKNKLYTEDIVFLNENYTLMKEDSWQKIHNSMPKKMFEAYNNWRNPYTSRPNFLKQKNK